MSTAQERWIESHPYLREVADFQQKILAAFAAAPAAAIAAPDWELVLAEYRQGTPLLEDHEQLVYASAAADALLHGLDRLVQEGLPQSILPSAQVLLDHLRQSEATRTAAIEWVYNGDPSRPPVDSAGLLRLLGWSAIVRTLAPVLNAFSEIRKEDEWTLGYCPVCGAPPALASIQANTPRLLACGYCRTTWQFRRIGCPFCENEDPNQLEVFTSEQETLFRLDHCKLCKGYVKTYTGHDSLELFLADWASLHLDLLARQNGMERKAGALLEL